MPAIRSFSEPSPGRLKPGARFVIDAVKAAETVLPHFRDRYEMKVADIRFAARNRYVLETGWIENRYTLTRGKRKEVRRARHRCYTCREVVSMLEDAGFSKIRLLGSLSGEPFRLGSSRLIVFAARSGQESVRVMKKPDSRLAPGKGSGGFPGQVGVAAEDEPERAARAGRSVRLQVGRGVIRHDADDGLF